METDGAVGDSTPAHFSRGFHDRGIHVSTNAAEVLLAPTTVAEFSGDSLPEGWFGRPWTDGGGVAQDNGRLLLDGGLAGHESLVRGGRSIELEATFGSRPDQHAGFGIDYEHVPWAMFSTKWGRRLYARTHFTLAEDKKLSGDWLDAPHRFRIDWRYLDMWFSVDGNHPPARAHATHDAAPGRLPAGGRRPTGGGLDAHEPLLEPRAVHVAGHGRRPPGAMDPTLLAGRRSRRHQRGRPSPLWGDARSGSRLVLLGAPDRTLPRVATCSTGVTWKRQTRRGRPWSARSRPPTS